MVLPLVAAKAYAAAQAQVSGASTAALGGGGSAPGGAHDFASILKNAMGEALQTSQNAEQKMIANVQGKADMIDVVTAIQSAQASLQTVMAVRDQVISAYQEIMHMAI
jgi:flagellar hook-basal body complex protein FliE